MPFRKKPVSIEVTMERPCLGSQIRIARLYLQLGITHEEMEQFNKHEEMAFLAIRGKHVSRMVSLTIYREAASSLLFSGIVAQLLRWFVPNRYLRGISQRFVALLGTKPFMRIIESVQMSNPLKPRGSQKRERS